MIEGGKFLDVLREAAGNNNNAIILSNKEWEACLEFATKHSLLAFVFPVAKKYLRDIEGRKLEPLFNQWLAYAVQINEPKITALRTTALIVP